MKITIERSNESLELIKALASKNPNEVWDAQIAIAEIVGPVLEVQANQAPVLSNLFELKTFDEGANPSIPLDAYRDITDENYFSVWTQAVDGGLPSNEIRPVTGELKITLSKIDSAQNFHKKYIAQGQIDVVARAFERMAQEMLVKDETLSATMIFAALAKAVTNGKQHVVRSVVSGRITLDDFNNLKTFSKRLYKSWAGGTPEGPSKAGFTDLFLSPEAMGDIRKMAYNPVNTEAAPMEGAVKNGIGAPDEIRRQLYSTAGDPTFFGVTFHEYNEFGIGQKYNKLFAKLAGETEFGGSKFEEATSQIILGIDNSVDSMYRFASTNGDGRTMTFEPDDQYTRRSGKIGWYGYKDEGRIILDDRALTAIIV